MVSNVHNKLDVGFNDTTKPLIIAMPLLLLHLTILLSLCRDVKKQWLCCIKWNTRGISRQSNINKNNNIFVVFSIWDDQWYSSIIEDNHQCRKMENTLNGSHLQKYNQQQIWTYLTQLALFVYAF